MGDEIVRRGGCACGAVRYEVRGAPLKVGLCHCADCRKETGSAFLHYGDWPLDAFSLQGDYRTWEGRSFCPECGTRLFHLSETEAEICLGSLDQAPTGLAPQKEGWIIRREPWLAPVAGASQHRHDPS
ncbi:MAG TPA: GFA family protein [Devosiaceae bacterium]|nr:GFA family protein [Devosiaceae bacterium]